MNKYGELMSRQEKLAFELIGLYRAHGYRRYRMEKFETYDVYLRHKDYIEGESIVTFTDSRGRLLALRPDVTLSLINNLPKETGMFKFYYDENIFRRDSEGDYREIRQIGAEFIGGTGVYPRCEAILLAVESLRAIGVECVLSIGNMDVFEYLLGDLDEDNLHKALSCINAKAFHELSDILGEERAKRITEIASIEGEPFGALVRAEKLTAGTGAESAAEELRQILNVVKDAGLIDYVKLDFSIIDNVRYYNGVVFRGYARGAAGTVLRGGCYDNILRRFDRKERAVGFSIYVSEIEQTLRSDTAYDVLVVTGDASAEETARAVRKYALAGKRVLAVKDDDENIKAKTRVFVGEAFNA